MITQIEKLGFKMFRRFAGHAAAIFLDHSFFVASGDACKCESNATFSAQSILVLKIGIWDNVNRSLKI